MAHQGFSVSDQLLKSFGRVEMRDASLLGAPLFEGPVLDKAWAKCCEDLAMASTRLVNIGCQDALILLRSSFSAPKVMHLLRCSPSSAHPSLQEFDMQSTKEFHTEHH